jgi:hypothetical protein
MLQLNLIIQKLEFILKVWFFKKYIVILFAMSNRVVKY